MTIKNIKSGFRVTGIYPFNKDVITLPEDNFESFRPEALSQRSGLAYIPLYSPIRQNRALDHPLNVFHPCTSTTGRDDLSNESSEDGSVSSTDTPATALTHHSSRFCQLLQLPQVPSRIPTKHIKSSGCALTSAENLLGLETKEREKEQAKKDKEERRLEREKKKREREKKKREQERLKLEKQAKKGKIYFTVMNYFVCWNTNDIVKC